jgi:hypothetical protein
MTTADSVRPRARAFWADVRFLLGIVLILVSIAGTWAVVAAARQTEPVFAAARTLVSGETVTTGDLRVVEVALGGAAASYLAPGTLEPGAVVARTIGEGELVPLAAVGPAGGARTTTVVVRSTGDVPAAVATGSVVEVWSAAQRERGQYDAPRILVPDAIVLSVTREQSVMGGSGSALELVIDRADVAATLAAIADGSSLSVVPVAGIAR